MSTVKMGKLIYNSGFLYSLGQIFHRDNILARQPSPGAKKWLSSLPVPIQFILFTFLKVCELENPDLNLLFISTDITVVSTESTHLLPNYCDNLMHVIIPILPLNFLSPPCSKNCFFLSNYN